MAVFEQVREAVLRGEMLQEDDRVIVAVSGGPDSVALLHLLCRLAPELHLSLHVFHLDHGMRGAASAGDAAYVANLAERWSLPVTVVTLPPGELKGLPGSFQANARRRRYQEIQSLAARVGATKVATGHNRDDQAETVLMRLLRGAGTRGLAGIPPVRVEEGLSFIRPILTLSRKEIENYCSEHKLSSRLDASNTKADYLRNRIRLELLPMLAREYNPAIHQRLAELAVLMREEEELLERLAEEAFARSCTDNPEVPSGTSDVVLDGARLSGEPVALARRVVRMVARRLLGPEAELGLPAVTRALEAAARSDGTHLVDLPGGLRLTVEYGRCRFEIAADTKSDGETNPDASADPAPGEGRWPIPREGERSIPELGLRVAVERVQQLPGAEGDELHLDADLLPGPLAIRFRYPGDRIWPVGMTGSRKLQDILVDAKVPRTVRDRVPLLVSGEDVLWVIGHRKDRRYLARAESRRIMRVEIRESEN